MLERYVQVCWSRLLRVCVIMIASEANVEQFYLKHFARPLIIGWQPLHDWHVLLGDCSVEGMLVATLDHMPKLG